MYCYLGSPVCITACLPWVPKSPVNNEMVNISRWHFSHDMVHVEINTKYKMKYKQFANYLLLSVCFAFLCMIKPFAFLAWNSHTSHFNFCCFKSSFTFSMAFSTFLKLGSISSILITFSSSLDSLTSSSSTESQ